MTGQTPDVISQTLGDLTGKLLVAMPGMGDPRFDQSVIFLCEHSASGAMGLIVNKPNKDVELGDVLESLEMESQSEAKTLPVFFGGPVELVRGFVLHTPDYQSSLETLNIGDDFAMTVTMDVLEDFANGKGPRQARMMLGYAGWGANQLENEIADNGWLICDASHDLVFGKDEAAIWGQALASMGLSPLTLSATAGRA